MPNWCYSTYKVTGNKDSIATLYKTLTNLQKSFKKQYKAYYGTLWLGNIITAFGGDWQKVHCRGDVTSFEMQDDILVMDTETAWQEMSEFRHFLEEKLPGIKIYYIEEECGCAIYNTNDASGDFFSCRYLLDCDEEPQYFDTLEDAKRQVSKIVGFEVEPTMEAISKALDDYVKKLENEDMFYKFHAFTVLDN